VVLVEHLPERRLADALPVAGLVVADVRVLALRPLDVEVIQGSMITDRRAKICSPGERIPRRFL